MSAPPEFDAASKYVKNMPPNTMKATIDQRLQFYKYFKQATKGDCEESKPGLLQFDAKAKWEAWNSVKGTTEEEAKLRYVQELDKSQPNWRVDAKKLGITLL